MNTKYGLFTYKTINVGDDIQSLAARRFLPQIDYIIDRDNIDNEAHFEKNDRVKFIMNGWYTHAPENWPPTNKQIDPLLLSMYINAAYDDSVKDAFLSSSSKRFMAENGPVGARDMATMQFLQDNGIDSYFSRCLTLTLQRDGRIERQDYILAVDVSEDVLFTIKKRTQRPVITASAAIMNKQTSPDQRIALAEFYLSLFQAAHCVVTSRLHTTLPCLALETPVLFIENMLDVDPKRFDGLLDLMNHSSEKKFLKDETFYNLDTPPSNKDSYKKYRKELIKTCREFTSFDADASFLCGKPLPIPSYDTVLIQAILDGLHSTNLLTESRQEKDALAEKIQTLSSNKSALEKDLEGKEKYINQLEDNLQGIYKSVSWKVTKPLRATKAIARKVAEKKK